MVIKLANNLGYVYAKGVKVTLKKVAWFVICR